MAYSTLRGRDMNVEREIARFLDTQLYNNGQFSKHQRTDDLENQMAGSDIILSIPGVNIENAIVDEKAQSQYINRPLPTFALELSFKTAAGDIVEGWLTDPDKKTEYYLCIWIWKAEKKWNPTAEQIHKLEYALVSRQKILDYLAQNGFNLNALKEKDAEIRKASIYGAHGKDGLHPFWFFYSDQLAEKPINIVIKKAVYLELAEIKGIVEV